MLRRLTTFSLLLLTAAATARAGVTPEQAQKLVTSTTPSLVAVQYTYQWETGRRDIIGAGVVVTEDGLIAASLGLFPSAIPDEQMKSFKIVIPGDGDKEEQEIDATFVGRDERTALAFLKPTKAGDQKWVPIKFEDVEVKTGDAIVSIGLLPKVASYKPYFSQAEVSAHLRGPIPQVMVTPGGLCTIGSPVFNADGKAIGLVNVQQEQPVMLNDPANALAGITRPPRFFVPAKDFVQSFEDPPVAGTPLKLPWLGVAQISGLKKEVADFFDLKGQQAVTVGDVVAKSPADKAGLKAEDVIVKLNGQPLERGDEPDETAQILMRKIRRMKIGTPITLSVLNATTKKPTDITITLDEQPKQSNTAARYYAEDLGFTARDLVFLDTYERKMPADQKGVVIALVKPNSAAQSGRMAVGDVVTEMNHAPVDTVEQFKTAYANFRKDSPKEAIVLSVIRQGQTQVLRIEPPQ